MSEYQRTQLKMRQALPLDAKILLSKRRIKEWYEAHGGKVYVSFSGGKDSTALLHLVRSMYPETIGVMFDTGMEFPELRDFALGTENVVALKPKKTFAKTLKDHGYPVISKQVAMAINRYRAAGTELDRQKRLGNVEGYKIGTIPKKWQFLIDAPFKISERCCDVLKKNPAKIAAKKYGAAFVGVMAGDSNQRLRSYQKCNAFDRGISAPMLFWTDEDVWSYLRLNNIEYAPVYDMGYPRTGCVFCLFGMEYDKDRFVKLARTHPQLHKYCMEKLGLKEVLEFLGYETGLES